MPNRWNLTAKIRMEQIENGMDITFSKVFVPFYKDIISKLEPTSILEIGAGTGHLAVELIDYCDTYYAIEPSLGMFDILCKTVMSHDVKLINKRIEEFEKDKTFDFVFSHLCAHAMENVEVLYEKIHELVNKKGTWMFSIPHPCFYNEYKNIISDDYFYMEERMTEFELTITKDERIIGKVPYYHRPLQFYLNLLTKKGLIIEGIEEIYPPKEIQALYGSKWKVPRYLVCHGRI